MRGAGSSLAIATSFTFKTYPVPPKVTYFELTLRPRVLLPSSDSIARASNLFAVFQAFGKTDAAAKGLGFSWHVTPEGAGLKVEILGQYTHASAGDRFEPTRQALEGAVKQSGEEDFEFGSRELSEWAGELCETSRGRWLISGETIILGQPIYSRCITSAGIGQDCQSEEIGITMSMCISTPR